ncbi:unnamed protein product [Soboliphyme baturini]|uniref:Transposase n=1 Tax=Soboliphyme baturini TaxID=241478 RepID=A0A183IL00_9BILA|nr:unnamed protein product [Soboliphyme baturini]
MSGGVARSRKRSIKRSRFGSDDERLTRSASLWWTRHSEQVSRRGRCRCRRRVTHLPSAEWFNFMRDSRREADKLAAGVDTALIMFLLAADGKVAVRWSRPSKYGSRRPPRQCRAVRRKTHLPRAPAPAAE